MLIGALIRMIIGLVRKNKNGSSGPTEPQQNRE
jgi:hypothetical protein